MSASDGKGVEGSGLRRSSRERSPSLVGAESLTSQADFSNNKPLAGSGRLPSLSSSSSSSSMAEEIQQMKVMLNYCGTFKVK